MKHISRTSQRLEGSIKVSVVVRDTYPGPNHTYLRLVHHNFLKTPHRIFACKVFNGFNAVGLAVMRYKVIGSYNTRTGHLCYSILKNFTVVPKRNRSVSVSLRVCYRNDPALGIFFFFIFSRLKEHCKTEKFYSAWQVWDKKITCHFNRTTIVFEWHFDSRRFSKMDTKLRTPFYYWHTCHKKDLNC